ncbi:DUF6338 family protein [Nocardia farcinica]|uniref:DUF6338 family protein n=1 Tax=Nocardia farcinica TaxID=37329 RepID=UPI0024551A87|nr:DUF6338 family protein [Nocardia farcinica]
MTPSTWLTLIAFFYFIAPGLLYDRLTAHKTAKRRESAFTEVSRVALVSTLCSAGGFLLIWGFAGICAWQDWKLLPDPSAMIKQGSVYFADNFLKVLITAAVLFVLSLAISYGAVLLIHRNTEGDIDFQSAWRRVMLLDRPEPKKTTITFARVTMKDGSVWDGHVAYFSPDMEFADREIVLTKPLRFKAKPETSPAPGSAPSTPSLQLLPAAHMFTVLKDADIASLVIRYERPDPAPAPAPSAAPAASSPATAGPAPTATP